MDLKNLPRTLYGHFLGKRWGVHRGVRFDLADEFLEDYQDRAVPLHKILKIHSKGFSVDSWELYELDDEKCKRYLSDAQYYSLHPANGEFTKWIDDKLTLKYLCSGTPLDAYMPEYYYQLDETGAVLCLPDCPEKKPAASVEDVARTLREKGALAIKLMNGAFGKGFYKAEYQDGVYLLNDVQLDEEAFCRKLGQLRNYLITEYFYPHPEMKEISPRTPGCIRYAVGQLEGKAQMLVGGLAIGTKASGYVENYAVGGVWCYLDENGCFHNGEIMDTKTNRNAFIDCHPDTSARLEGRIPHWEEIVKAGAQFCQHFPQLKYLGFDFVVTSKDQVKILEVNSLSSLDCFQNNIRSVFDMPAGAFFRSLLNRKSGR